MREGTFTSAAQDRKGLFELPWDGTRRRGRGGGAGAVRRGDVLRERDVCPVRGDTGPTGSTCGGRGRGANYSANFWCSAASSSSRSFSGSCTIPV